MKSMTLICIASVFVALVFAGGSHAAIDPDTILGAWLLDEGTGDTTADASGNGHDGTLTGSPAWVGGAFGNALQFNGSSTYVDCTAAEEFNVNVFSVAFWFNFPSTQGWNHMVSRGSHVTSGEPGSVNWGVMMYSAQETILYETFNDTGWVGISTASSAGEWHHVAATLDETAMQLYHDGELAGTASGGVLLDASRAFLIGARSDAGAAGGFFNGSLDEVLYVNAILAPEDIETLMFRGLAKIVGGPPVATNPQPAIGQIDVPRDPVLSWTAGEFAATHNVYFSENVDDVNNRAASALIAEDITETSVTPGRLDFEKTYYWLVDEVNSAPDYAVYEGAVWSFTAEPFSYPVENVIASSNAASEAGQGPENTINGSGLNAQDQHSIESTDMWLATPTSDDPVYIEYEFDAVYKLYEMLVWNYNVTFELILGFGLKDVTIEYSENGTDWMVLGDAELARGTAATDYASNTTVDLAGVAARYVRLTINGAWSTIGQYGLSEVRFMYIPVQAREPEPADGATGVDPGTALAWRTGRDAAAHEVYLSTDEQTVIEGTALVDTISENSYAPDALDFGSTYYWKVNEVNEAEVPPTWDSDVWTFQTLEYVTVDDFESYDNDANPIYDTWIDGWVNGSGSTAGYLTEPFAETSIVNSGRQSMPLLYDNSASPYYSEVECDLGGLDLDTNGADTLRLFVAGQTPPYVETADGTIVMSAIGADIWNAADEFRYAYMNLSGDGSIVAQVDGLYRSNEWIKGGVMIRESTDAGSTFAAVYLTGDYGVRYQARVDTDGSATSDSTVVTDDQIAQEGPVWVKIERVGNTFNGYYSTDGADWTLMVWSPQTIAMGSDVTIGLALTSHDSAISTGAAFSGIATTGGVTGSWQTAEIGVAQPTDAGNSIEPLYVAIEDSAGNLAVVTHPNAGAAGISAWQEWLIPYSDLAGINLNNVSRMYIGVGDPDNPSAGGAGTIFVDDISYGRPVSAE